MTEKNNNSPSNNQLNKKHFAILVSILGVIAIAFVIFTNTATSTNPSLPESRDIFTLHDNYNMTVVVVFDEEPPIVRFITPEGYYVDMNNIRYRPGSNFIQYFLPNATPGVWRMAYDPLTNTEISTPYSVYMNHIFVRNFDATSERDTNGNITVSFDVSADDSGKFNYELHAVFIATDNSISDKILLIEGYGMLNEYITLSVGTEDIQGMGGFMLYLTTYVQHGQAAIRDSAWLDLRLIVN